MSTWIAPSAAGQARNPDRVYEFPTLITPPAAVVSGAANTLSASFVNLHTFGADCSSFMLDIAVGTNHRYMLDLALDGTALVQNLPFQANAVVPFELALPFKATAGQVLQAKLRAGGSTLTADIGVKAARKNSLDAVGYTSATVYNADTAGTRSAAPAVTSAVTPADWTQVIAGGVIAAHGAFAFSASERTSVASLEYTTAVLGIRVGGVGGTVTEIGRKLIRSATSTPYAVSNLTGVFATALPAGAEIVAKVFAQTTGGSDYGFAVIGFNA